MYFFLNMIYVLIVYPSICGGVEADMIALDTAALEILAAALIQIVIFPRVQWIVKRTCKIWRRAMR